MVTGFVDYQLVPTAFNNLVAHHIPVLVAGETPDGGKTSTAQLGFYPARPADDLMQKLDLESVPSPIVAAKHHILYVGVTDSPETKQEAAYPRRSRLKAARDARSPKSTTTPRPLTQLFLSGQCGTRLESEYQLRRL